LKKTVTKLVLKMKICDIAKELNLSVISGENGMEREVSGAYVSDLLSDVIGNAKEGSVWITLQIHHNVVAVASLKDLAAVIIVRGAKPDDETIRRSNEEHIPVLSTSSDTFTIAGELFNLLKKE
jgi:predicted transcriptional regulator